jgi:hypothetical protein
MGSYRNVNTDVPVLIACTLSQQMRPRLGCVILSQ